MADVSYAPGVLTAVVGHQCWALVEASPDSPVTMIWQQLRQGGTAEALLVSLLAGGLAGVPGFSLLVAEADGQHRIFCRGAVGATVAAGPAADGTPPGDTGDGAGRPVSQRIDGAGLLTWRERVLDRAERIFLGEPPAGSALRLPATSGVLLAGAVVIDITSPAARDTASRQAEKPKKSIVFFPDTITMTHPGSVAGLDPGEPPGISARSPARYQAAPPLAAPPWQAPPAEAWSDRTRPDGSLVAGAVPSAPVPVRPPEPYDGTPSGAMPSGLIDAPPWMSSPAGPPSRDTAPPGEPGTTVKRGELSEHVARTNPPDRIGPVIPALLCPSGHVNPPSDAACRRCRAPLPHDPVPVSRPVLGVLRLSLGDVITLDRGVLMGRNPRTDFGGPDGSGGAGGGERPHVVKLPSAGGDISRTHLRVTLDGWHVLVTDLHSTNGTLVTLPGRDPQQLRPGEPVPIQPGTVVALADGIDFRYEAAE